MEIERIVIHELEKDRGNVFPDVFISNQLIPVVDNTITLVSKLHDSYKSDKIIYALFDNSPSRYFPRRYKEYFESQRNDRDFIDFTEQVLKDLRTLMSRITFATGGFFVFTEYIVNGTAFLGIFLIRDTNGVMFNKNESLGNRIVELDTVQYMNIDKMAMACRININKYETNTGKYLTFVKRRQAQISGYFIDWIAAAQPESSKEFTETLYDMISNMPTPIDPDTEEQMELNKYRQEVAFLLRGNRGNVDLVSLGEHFYNDPEIFVRYRDENSIDIDNEFRADKTALKRFFQLQVKAAGIQLIFSRGAYNDQNIRFGDDNTVVIDNQEFKEALRQELNDEY